MKSATVVTDYGWLTTRQMIDAGLAEKPREAH
jgi:hypothetical protein